MTPKEILNAWDVAVAVSMARIRAFNDPKVTPAEYGALSMAENATGEAAVKALGGYMVASLPYLTGWDGAK